MNITFEGKNILLVSPEPWGDYFVSKHHYTVGLVERAKNVYFLNPPSEELNIQQLSVSKLWLIDYAGFPRGLRFYPVSLQKYFIQKIFNELQNLADVSFDVIWSFDTSVFYDFRALPVQVLKILHLVDYTQNYQIKRAASTADVCFCTTDYIQNRLKRYSDHVFKIHHGYSAVNHKQIGDVSLPGANSLKAVYVGNLAIPYLDWQKILAVATIKPDIDFIFIGPESASNLSKNPSADEDLMLIKALPNTYFPGPVPAHEVAAYLEQADILLVVYKYEKYPEQLASPHKLMDYLASGKPIVATWTEEYAGTDLLYMAKTTSDFVATFSWVVSHLDQCNRSDQVLKRKNFAHDNSYARQLDRIESILHKLKL